MSDRMIPLSFEAIMSRALSEYNSVGTVFGISKIYREKNTPITIFGEALALPFGPAAGPHTQLAQNIVAAFAAGARFFELKTVQTLDGEDLPVSKPCILAHDEGYNVEWSTELYVPEALTEYIKAWFAIKLLAKELNLGDENAFVFNMSVGYDLEGIQSPKIDKFIEGLKNAELTDAFRECREWARKNVSLFNTVDLEYINAISANICRSVTLSTLHGCPPDEIERIAAYLIKQKGLNTFVKCNPTLLGYETARKTLDSLGFDYIKFDDHHFKADLQAKDAVPMLKRLQAIANENNVEFGVKLTNTFPVDVAQNELPGTEMYMSGRSLFPLSIRVAKLLSEAFGGKLRISYSGGADENNIAQLYNAGIFPVTVATTLLKPLGYNRLARLADILSKCNCKNLDVVNVAEVNRLCEQSMETDLYKKPIKLEPSRKKGEVPLLDCFKAPCRTGCPFGQDIPTYLRLEKAGDNENALRVILEKNPLPFITGTICAHNCQSSCSRGFVDGPIEIRAAKLRAAKAAFEKILPEIKPRKQSGKRIAIVGGGVAGMAVAFFMARDGATVEIFEKQATLGGIVRHVIPRFRISEDAIEADTKLLTALGVKVHVNTEITEKTQLQGFDDIIIATGAWGKGDEVLKQGEAMGALEFLSSCEKSGYELNIGENVAVIGGGNTAMDTARAAKRVKGVKNVRLIYRRTKRYMPADAEELELAIGDGVEFCELLAPKDLMNGVLTCEKMRLSKPDEKGRLSVEPTGETVLVNADTVIAAVGQKIETKLYEALGANIIKGKPRLDSDTLECSVKNVYAIGDGAHGAATVAEAIADAAAVARAIGVDFSAYENKNNSENREKAVANRCNPHECMECASVCENCVDVCPNRANISIKVDGMPHTQIIHIDDMCNECGNCTAFCPYDSSPYKSKFTMFSSEKTFNESKNEGFLLNTDGNAKVRFAGVVNDYSLNEDSELYMPLKKLINVCVKELNML